MTREAVIVWLLVASVVPEAAQAQDVAPSRTVAFDTVVGIQDYFFDGGASKTQVIFDTSTSVEVLANTQVTVRPVFWRMRGTWLTLVDQLSVRYQFQRGSNWRIEAGRFPSPIGLGMMENRASTNDGLMWCHRPLYMPLPSIGDDLPTLSLVSAIYPVGVLAATATSSWDLRAAVIDRAPVEYWHPTTVSHTPNMVVGGGITPWEGFRIGAGTAFGSVGQSSAGRADLPYTLVNVEGEYGFGYTKISGEWTRDELGTPSGHHIAHGWTLQVRQTLTPRVFVHSRMTAIDSPSAMSDEPEQFVTSRMRVIDSTVGYSLTPDVTLRAGYTVIKPWTSGVYDHQFGLSLIWAKRWW